MKITNPITLDVARSNSYICLLAKQFDENSRFLIATLTNNGEPMIIPAGAAVTLRATRPDGEPVAVPGIINNDGTTTVEIDDYILEVVGSASLSIEVAIGDEILTSASFNLTIQRADGNGWLRVYVAAASLAAGNYYITIGDTPYAFTTTQAIPAGGAIYFNSDGGTAQTRDASGNVLDASLTLTAGTSGTELTSDVPTMSFLTAIAGRMVTIEAEMSQKANIDGSYPLLHAGTADNLMTGNGATQAIPFIQEGTGKGNGEATVKAGGVLQLKKKLGNTVGVNQLLPNGDFASSSGWSSWYYGGTVSVANDTGTVTGNGNIDISHALGVTIPAGHTVLFLATVKGSASGNGSFINISGQFPITTSFAFVARIGVVSGAITRAYIARQGSGSFTMDVKNVSVIDLTLWFGSNDRIPSDLLSHSENWGRYYAGSLDYNAGTLNSADGTVLTSKGADGTTVLAEVDTGSEVLRGVEGSRDEKLPSGAITRNRAVVDLSTLAWTWNGTYGAYVTNSLASVIKKPADNYTVPTIISEKYIPNSVNGASTVGNIVVLQNNAVWVFATSGDVPSGLLEYPLATPTTEQGTAYAENIPCDDFGSLMWTNTKGIPQGNEIFYPTDLKGALESIVAAIPSANGTYTLHATVTTAGVTFSWS